MLQGDSLGEASAAAEEPPGGHRARAELCEMQMALGEDDPRVLVARQRERFAADVQHFLDFVQKRQSTGLGCAHGEQRVISPRVRADDRR